MSLSLKEVQNIAHLARIDITPTENVQVVAELNNILDFVAQLSGVQTQGIAPMSHALATELRLRADVVSATTQRDEFQALAPESVDGVYLVPKVME